MVRKWYENGTKIVHTRYDRYRGFEKGTIRFSKCAFWYEKGTKSKKKGSKKVLHKKGEILFWYENGTKMVRKCANIISLEIFAFFNRSKMVRKWYENGI